MRGALWSVGNSSSCLQSHYYCLKRNFDDDEMMNLKLGLILSPRYSQSRAVKARIPRVEVTVWRSVGGQVNLQTIVAPKLVCDGLRLRERANVGERLQSFRRIRLGRGMVEVLVRFGLVLQLRKDPWLGRFVELGGIRATGWRGQGRGEERRQEEDIGNWRGLN